MGNTVTSAYIDERGLLREGRSPTGARSHPARKDRLGRLLLLPRDEERGEGRSSRDGRPAGGAGEGVPGPVPQAAGVEPLPTGHAHGRAGA